MPIYEYKCPDCCEVHSRLRPMKRRKAPVVCPGCGGLHAQLIISRAHVPPDGVYSYAPNVGDPKAFERRAENIKRDKEAGRMRAHDVPADCR